MGRSGAFAFAFLFICARAAAITVTAVGDVNLGSDFPNEESLPADEGRGLLAPVHELLRGDIVFGNLEGPILDGGTSDKCGLRATNCYAFRTPTRLASRLREAGFTVMGLANNHALDFGTEGRASSRAALEALGIGTTGEVGSVATLAVGGLRVAVIAYAPYPHSNNLLEIDQARQTVAELAKTHDLVLVSAHAGSEGTGAGHVSDAMERMGSEPRGNLIAFSHAVVDAGADLVIGHGPHLLRGLELYRGRLIAYSLGNFCTFGRFNLSGPLGRGAVLQVTLDRDGAFVSGQLHATIQSKQGVRIDPAQGGLADVRALTAADFPYTAPTLDALGRIGVGPTCGAGLFTLAEPEERAALRTLLGTLEKRHSREKLATWFGDERAALLPEVVERFAKPAEQTMTYEKYREIFVKPEILEAGRRFLEAEKDRLADAEQRFGVERQAIAAIAAVESRFGERPGKFSVFNALATQAIRMPRRVRFATDELEALLQVYPSDPLGVTGSYAGAVGFVQFMPTSILRHGHDLDGDGTIDLQHWPDAIASCARYLHDKGWRRGQGVGRGSANYQAIFRYNPSHHYAQVVAELATAFGLEAQKPAGSKPAEAQKPAGSKPAEAKKPASSKPAEAQVLRAPEKSASMGRKE